MVEEFKTLKDMLTTFEYDTTKRFILLEDLKDEAIKWLKKTEEVNLYDEETNTRLIKHALMGKEWIKHFFNLTEEDLK